VLLDIEGTTTPVDFVTRVLFPYAREHVRDFLIRRAPTDPALRDDLERLYSDHRADERAGQSPPPWRDDSPAAVLDSAVAYVHWLMDRDRKSTVLKSLQGRIWEEGYRSGRLQGQVYPDVPRAFARWRAQGREMAIFSSGSVLAQKLIFGHSTAGDLGREISGYFDTTTGAKREVELRTLRRGQEILGRMHDLQMLIDRVRDVQASLAPPSLAVWRELDAARAAGMQTALSVRAAMPVETAGHRVIRDFDGEFPS